MTTTAGHRVGKIRYKEFVRFVEKKKGRRRNRDDDSDSSSDDNGGRRKQSRSRSRNRRNNEDSSGDDGDSSGEEEEDIMAEVRKEFKRITKSSRGPPRVRATFEELDLNGDGEVSKREFKDGLKQMSFRFNDKKIKKLTKKLDSDGNGAIDYEEFERFCLGKKSSSGGNGGFDVDNYLMKKMKKSTIAKKTNRMSDKLSDYAGGRSSINARDMESFLRDNMDELSRGEAKEVVRACDENDTGKIKCSKFVDMF